MPIAIAWIAAPACFTSGMTCSYWRFGKSPPSVMIGTMTARGVSRRSEPSARLRTARRAMSMPARVRGHRRPMRVLQQLGVRRVVGEDRRPVGEADDGDLVALRHLRDERRAAPRGRAESAHSEAALLSTRMAMSIGSVACETRSTSRVAPSSRMTKSSGRVPRPARPSDRPR